MTRRRCAALFAALGVGATLLSACALLTWGTKNTINKADAEASAPEASGEEGGSEAGDDGSVLDSADSSDVEAETGD